MLDLNAAKAVLAPSLKRHEGDRQFPYVDTRGNLSIGIGRNLRAKGLSEDERLYLLNNDINEAVALLDSHLPWWRSEDPVRAATLIELTFNLGMGKLLEFHSALAHWAAGAYDAAADDLVHSQWHTQVGERADDLEQQLRSGKSWLS